MSEKSTDDILNYKNLPHIIDISALSVATTESEVLQLARTAEEYGFIAAYVMPCHTQYLRGQLGKQSNVILGAPIGFPTGTDLTNDKVFQVKEMTKLGCTEFDMVICVSKLKSHKYDYVKNDIARVIEAADGFPVKVILEVAYLTDEEIKIGSEIVAGSGARFVKTGTGYAANPTTFHHVEIIKQTVGDSIKIKVAGGVKDFSTLKSFYLLGAERFGIGMASAIKIIQERR